MKLALEMKGLDPYQVSKNAGLNRNYLWESFKRRKGSLGGYKKIADVIGLRISWLIQEEGEPFIVSDAISPLDPQSVIVALKVLLERPGLDQEVAHDAALKVLDILERPPDGNSTIDKSSRILGALRVYVPPPAQ